MKNKKENILIINRWRDNYADYSIMIDHYKNNVAYIVNENGSIYLDIHKGLPHCKRQVSDLKNLEEVFEAVQLIINDLGIIDRVIALSEFDLYVAAYVREKFNVPGVGTREILRYIDKVEMKSVLQKTDIRIPKFISGLDDNNLNEFIDQNGFPIILKPKKGASSEGVNLVYDKNELKELVKSIDLNLYECEEYIDGNVYHIDGIIQNEKMLFVIVFRYINTCYEYAHDKKPVASIIVDDESERDKFIYFTKEVLAGLEMKSGVFHLEVIKAKNDEIVFLEIGARQGGAEVVPIVKELYDVDLMEANLKIQLNEEIEINNTNGKTSGGFLLIPEPSNVPCKVVNRTSMKGKSSLIIKEILPDIGSVLDGHGGYYDISGKFWLKGDSDEVERIIYRIISEYGIETEKIAG